MSFSSNTEESMETLCSLMCKSTVKTTSEQRNRLIHKMEKDAHMEALLSVKLPPSPLLNSEYVMDNPENMSLPSLERVENEEIDNWIQCDTCEKWHKVEITGTLPDKWYCADISKLCRPPQKAENNWPAKRAKRFVTHFSDYKRAPNYMESLKFLAKRKGLTLEQLYKTTPQEYVGDRHTCHGIMYGNWRYYSYY